MSKLLDFLVLLGFQCFFVAFVSAQYNPPCAEGDSLFSKRDLIELINRSFNGELKIWSHIQEAFNTTSQSVRDQVLKDFNDRLAKFESHPIPKLQKILADLDNNLKTEVTRQVQIAAATLQNIPSREKAFDVVFNNTQRLYAELDKSRMICNLNGCSKTPVTVGSRGKCSLLKTNYFIKEEQMCGEIEYVMSTINQELHSFEATEIEKLNKNILNGKNMINENIFQIMEMLRAEVVKIMGPTIYDVNYLQDEHVTYKQILKDFNKESFIDAIDKQIIHINSQLIDLNRLAKKFRQYCLTCTHNNNMVKKAETEKIPRSNLLQRLLTQKFESIDTTIEAAIDDWLQNLKEIVNETDLVEKTIAKLQPLEEEIFYQVQTERKKIEDLKKMAPEDSLDQVRKLSFSSVTLSQGLAEVIFILTHTLN